VPISPDPSQNFINALSDFWTVFFKDTNQIKSYFKGVQINVGQIYIQLLETVLGTSLRSIPVFSKEYYRQFTVSEDELFYVEGATPAADRYQYTPEALQLHAVKSLMNKVISPTNVLESGRDYEVSDNAILFSQNLFDTDGLGTSIALFPVRTVVKQFAADYQDLLSRDWKAAGVRVGDYFRFRAGTGSVFKVRITGIETKTVFLSETLPEFTTDLRYRRFSVAAVRTPFDAVKEGLVLPDHPTITTRLSTNATDAALIPGTTTFDFSAEPYYQGVWAPFSFYAAGEVVTDPFGVPVRALISHLSPAVYSPTPWTSMADKYYYVHDPEKIENEGLFAAIGFTATTIQLDRPANFVAGALLRAQITMVGYASGLIGSPKPILTLANTYLVEGTVTVTARRKQDVYTIVPDGTIVLHPENQAVEEGVDYLVDYETGALTILSGWDPVFYGRISYTWDYDIVTYTHAPRGAWQIATAYVLGDIVLYLNTFYVCAVAISIGSAPPSADWVLYSAPFSFGKTHPVREIAMWGTDALVDREALYTNFGYLLAPKRPSSEQYRAFLRGVAQLFVLGPALERFESALNVMAELPVIRDDGEILRSYDSGIFYAANDGQVIDSGEGRNGTLDNALSQFSAPTAAFFASDVGAVVRVKIGEQYSNYTVTAVLSPTTVTVAPAPPDATGLIWNFTHVALTRRFRSTSFAFTDADAGALIWISDAANARNNGLFEIVAVENASTVELDAPFGFTDESALKWQLSRAKVQTITTSRTSYEIPLRVPVRPDIPLTASIDTLTFQAFETITNAFVVEDYIQDPTWWHNTSIPEHLIQAIAGAAAARRIVTASMIEHQVSPLDQALIGDFGLAVGVDDEGRPGQPREGTATWFGGSSIALSFSAGVPTANARDVGRYVSLEGPGFDAQFKITRVVSATVLELDGFPPREMRGLVPPVPLYARLSPIIVRRTVGFVMMDRFMKYHAIHVAVDEYAPISPEFLVEATELLKQAKPGFTEVYFESPLDFFERMVIGEDLTLGVGLPLTERILAADNTSRVGPPGLLLANDAFRFDAGSQVIPAAPGTYALTPVLPPAGLPPRVVRFHAVKGWFDLSVLVGGRRLAEGYDYILDRLNGTVTVLAPGLPGPTTFNYVVAILRTRLAGDPLDPGETEICTNGSDPSIWWAPTQSLKDAGLIDRAVQLTIAP
jgi:hypothetical protein